MTTPRALPHTTKKALIEKHIDMLNNIVLPFLDANTLGRLSSLNKIFYFLLQNPKLFQLEAIQQQIDLMIENYFYSFDVDPQSGWSKHAYFLNIIKDSMLLNPDFCNLFSKSITYKANLPETEKKHTAKNVQEGSAIDAVVGFFAGLLIGLTYTIYWLIRTIVVGIALCLASAEPELPSLCTTLASPLLALTSFLASPLLATCLSYKYGFSFSACQKGIALLHKAFFRGLHSPIDCDPWSLNVPTNQFLAKPKTPSYVCSYIYRKSASFFAHRETITDAIEGHKHDMNKALIPS